MTDSFLGFILTLYCVIFFVWIKSLPCKVSLLDSHHENKCKLLTTSWRSHLFLLWPQIPPHSPRCSLCFSIIPLPLFLRITKLFPFWDSSLTVAFFPQTFMWPLSTHRLSWALTSSTQGDLLWSPSLKWPLSFTLVTLCHGTLVHLLHMSHVFVFIVSQFSLKCTILICFTVTTVLDS